ncbi:MAG: hypothetical protein J6X78_00520 [Treponema sp.]|nr:hypothetical protein [Treponema sp.]
MSYSIVGNNRNPDYFLTWYEVCIDEDEDEYEDMEGETVDEQDIFARRAIVPKNSNSATVTIVFYYYAPASEWYWDYNYGVNYYPVVPVVFAADSNWQLTQCLNASFYETSFAGQANGWKSLNVTLTRKLVKDERIVFGVYSDLHGYASNGEVEDPYTTMSYFYWTRAHRRDYASQIAYVSSPEFISQQRNISNDYEISLYMQYENEIESVAYTRTVLGNVGAVTANTRKLVWKRAIPCLWNLSSRLTRKSDWKRNASSDGVLSAGAFRSNHLFRAESDNKIFFDSYDERIFFFRHHEDQEEITARSFRSNRMNIEKSDGFSFSDSLQQLLLIIRSVFSSSDALDNFRHKANYKRMPESIIDDEEMVVRSGDNLRSFSDEIDFEALPFTSRIFYRAVQTVMSFWDWLRGKIREANNVVTFFCPIDLEITMECRI